MTYHASCAGVDETVYAIVVYYIRRESDGLYMGYDRHAGKDELLWVELSDPFVCRWQSKKTASKNLIPGTFVVAVAEIV